MRNRIVAGNWKMNLNYEEGISLVEDVMNSQNDIPDKMKVMFSPAYPFLNDVGKLTRDSDSYITAAQNMNDNEKGAYTGEVSARMLNSIDISYVIIGHSERRHVYHETEEIIRKKMNLAVENQMIPILAIGEKESVRREGNHIQTVISQLDSALQDLNSADLTELIIAYEPVWAIGTGLTALPQEAQDMHESIRVYLNENYDKIGDNTSILYGGSVKPGNAEELFDCEDIDGALIGGASLTSESFTKIIEIMKNTL